MKDLIERQKAIEAMSESLKRVFPEHRQIAEKCLNVLPSAQPEIVHCRDCMYYGTYYRGNESKPVITHLCKWCLDRTMEPDDYCSHAVRRTDNANDIT